MRADELSPSDAARLFAAKAPVNRGGAQRTADAARRAFWHLLTEAERSDVHDRLIHCTGLAGHDDRRYFDEVMKPIVERLNERD